MTDFITGILIVVLVGSLCTLAWQSASSRHHWRWSEHSPLDAIDDADLEAARAEFIRQGGTPEDFLDTIEEAARQFILDGLEMEE
jgi:hypothetical protein